MNKEIAEKWVAALRSGKYEQGKEYLSYKGKYCCLGVLCELAVVEADCVVDFNSNGLKSYQGACSLLPPYIQAWSEIKSDGGYIPALKGNERHLYQLNDARGLSFLEIADIIEKHYEEL